MAAHQAPPSLGFSRQEHWSGLPFPSPVHESEKWKWSLSVMSDPQWPHGVLPGSSIHGIFQAGVLEWGAIAFSEIWLYPASNFHTISLMTSDFYSQRKFWDELKSSLISLFFKLNFKRTCCFENALRGELLGLWSISMSSDMVKNCHPLHTKWTNNNKNRATKTFLNRKELTYHRYQYISTLMNKVPSNHTTFRTFYHVFVVHLF